MSVISKDAVTHAADNLGGVVVEDYSGRGMNGRTCVGFKTDPSYTLGDVAQVIAEYIVDADEEYEYLADDREEFREFVREDVRPAIREDSLGRGVIFYFPGVTT